jgi:hypothetical protein
MNTDYDVFKYYGSLLKYNYTTYFYVDFFINIHDHLLIIVEGINLYITGITIDPNININVNDIMINICKESDALRFQVYNKIAPKKRNEFIIKNNDFLKNFIISLINDRSKVLQTNGDILSYRYLDIAYGKHMINNCILLYNLIEASEKIIIHNNKIIMDNE